MYPLLTIAVLGGGSFGTVIGNTLADNGSSVVVWMRDPASAEAINSKHLNEKYFPGFLLNSKLTAACDLAGVVSRADLIFVALPSKSFRAVLKQAAPFAKANQIWISCTKGVEQSTFLLMHQLIEQELPRVRLGVLSGPNFAQEILQRMPSASVVASKDEGVCETIQQYLGNSYFRIYTNKDIYGVELAGALKNIYAIATGMADAAGTGENTRSLLITRSLAEMSRFAQVLGANPMTFIGLAGVGDLVLTCSSNQSRNYRVGYALGHGKTVDQTLSELGQTAEGVNTVKSVKFKADDLGVYMPLVSGLYKILFEDVPWIDVVSDLMQGSLKEDVEFVS